jgi:hypothetical protein
MPLVRPRRSRQGSLRCVSLACTGSERRTMNSDQNRSAVPTGESRPVWRPPYGLPLRDRPPRLAASDSLGWRRYSTPVPPNQSALRSWDRLTRPAVIVGFLACVGASLWSSSWGTAGSSPRTTVASMPTSRPMISERPAVLALPPTFTSAPRTPPPSARSRPNPKAPKNKALLSGNRRRPASVASPRRDENVPVAPRRKTAIPVDHEEAPRRSDRKGGDNKRVVPLIAAMCDERFPPSLPEFRLRNRACHLIFGQRATSGR